SSECVSAFDLISAPFGVKMSQKPSLPQSLQTVQLVLTGNSQDEPRCVSDRLRYRAKLAIDILILGVKTEIPAWFERTTRE
ncbi:MAG: hypothetical protein ABSE40_24780, partial [Candidatus Sulfotelmatobacter sp.]